MNNKISDPNTPPRGARYDRTLITMPPLEREKEGEDDDGRNERKEEENITVVELFITALTSTSQKKRSSCRPPDTKKKIPLSRFLFGVRERKE